MVSPGDSIYGYVWGTNCDPQGVCSHWQTYTTNNRGASSTLNTSSYNDALSFVAGGTIEVHSNTSCSQLPGYGPASTTFTNVTVRDTNNNTLQPAWSSGSDVPLCAAAATGSGTTNTVSWCVRMGWANNPNCDGQCGQYVSNGCGGTVRCPAQTKCPPNFIWDSASCICTTVTGLVSRPKIQKGRSVIGRASSVSIARRAVAACALTLALFHSACGTNCLALAADYANELPNALSCDPTSSADQCSDSINVVFYIESSAGQDSLQGLGSCLHSANPQRDMRLNKIFSEYQRGGCQIRVAPLCPRVIDCCIVGSDGKGKCFL